MSSLGDHCTEKFPAAWLLLQSRDPNIISGRLFYQDMIGRSSEFGFGGIVRTERGQISSDHIKRLQNENIKSLMGERQSCSHLSMYPNDQIGLAGKKEARLQGCVDDLGGFRLTTRPCSGHRGNILGKSP